jgi:hypothetical protein
MNSERFDVRLLENESVLGNKGSGLKKKDKKNHENIDADENIDKDKDETIDKNRNDRKVKLKLAKVMNAKNRNSLDKFIDL